MVAAEFEKKWNFFHCLGAIDGKHVTIIPPPQSGSLYYNYKQFNSIVLLAVVDAAYRFLYIDVGSYGRISDGGVFNNSSLAAAICNGGMHFPPAEPVQGSNTILPFCFVADDAFALKLCMLKPYSKRLLGNEECIYNYRLSRARRLVENTIGHLSQRFRILGKPIALEPTKVQKLVMACCCIHNYLIAVGQSTGNASSPIDELV